MNKALLFAVLLAGLATVLLVPKSSPLGVSFQEGTFGVGTVTNTQVSCNTTTTLLAATSTRSSFIAANVGTNIVYLCRSGNLCSATSGIPLYPAGFTTSTGDPIFTQIDGYTGPYRCAGVAVNTVNISWAP